MNDTLKTILNHARLVNPARTIFSAGSSVWDAPGGGDPNSKWRLAKSDKLNMALWNLIYSAPAAFGLAYLINNVANQRAENDVEKKLNRQLIDKVQATRPRLVADPNLADITSFTELPGEELRRIDAAREQAAEKSGNRKKLTKKAAGNLDEIATETVRDAVSDAFLSALPLTGAALAAYGGISLSNHLNKERIKKELLARRMQLRNLQAKLDHDMLVSRGLIKGASETVDQAKVDRMVAEAKASTNTNRLQGDRGSTSSLWDMILRVPVLAHVLMATALVTGAYSLLRKGDKNEKRLKHLKDMQLGSNVLQDAPQLSVLDLPVKAEDILDVPALTAGKEAVLDVKPVDEANIIQEVKKKDALF